jgi:hypothetical protein
MAFSPKTVEDLLLKANRHCCLCRQFKGKNLEVHHIVPQAEGGGDDPDNAIVLCFDCHADVVSYNPSHPRGRKYTSAELRRHRDEWFTVVAAHPAGQPWKVTTEPQGRVKAGTSPPGGIQIAGNNNIAAGGNISINTRTIQRIAFTPGPQHIAEEQARKISEIIKELAEIDQASRRPSKNPYQLWYGKLKRHFNVSNYRAIPAEQGEQAIEWLLRHKAMQRPRLRRADNEAWCKSLYTAIWARSKQRGLSKQDVYDIAYQRLGLKAPIGSLKELGERNLHSLHNIIFGMR